MFITDSKKARAMLRKECPLIVESKEENEITATWLVGLMSKRLLSLRYQFGFTSVDGSRLTALIPMTPHHPLSPWKIGSFRKNLEM